MTGGRETFKGDITSIRRHDQTEKTERNLKRIEEVIEEKKNGSCTCIRRSRKISR